MLAGFLCALVLGGVLLVVRARAAGEGPASSAWRGDVAAIHVWLGGLVVLGGTLPVLLPALAPRFWGDDSTHARIASDLAREGLPHLWVDSYLSGFPFAHHYPPMGWLLASGLIRLGLRPVVATTLLGSLATVAMPLALYVGAVRARARPLAAALGALVIAWVSPYNAFVGGLEVFFKLGLFSQVLGTPLCIGLAASIVSARRRWVPPLFGVLAMATHPQLTVCTLVVLACAALAAADKHVLHRCVRGGLAAMAIGIALYGQGIRSLGIPFGWPENLPWLQLGFAPDRLEWFFVDGDLLDLGRTPIVTALGAASMLVLIVRVQRPVARAALVALLVAVAASVSGPALATAGTVGAVLLAFLQPLRMLGLIPIAVAVAVVVAFEEASAALHASMLGASFLPVPFLLLFGVLAIPDRVQFARNAMRSSTATEPCGPATPRGYSEMKSALAALPPDRFWYDHEGSTPLRHCVLNDGLEIAVPGPIATTGGAGAHVGLLWLAYRQLRPERAGSAARAEALGIRYVLQASSTVPPGWTEVAKAGDLELLSLGELQTTLVGAGCLRETWHGSDAALRSALQSELRTPAGADRLLSPTDLIALSVEPGPLRIEKHAERCGTGVVDEIHREPGALEADVIASAPLWAVLRVTAFPSWRIEVDGIKARDVRMIAPGFLAVPIAGGQHHVLATASSLDDYGWFVLSGILAALLWAFAGPTPRPLPEPPPR